MIFCSNKGENLTKGNKTLRTVKLYHTLFMVFGLDTFHFVSISLLVIQSISLLVIQSVKQVNLNDIITDIQNDKIYNTVE